MLLVRCSSTHGAHVPSHLWKCVWGHVPLRALWSRRHWQGPQKSSHANEYRPVFHGLDAVNGVGAAVLSHVGVDVGIVCHQVGFGAAVRHSAELERRSDSRRVFQLCRHTTRKKWNRNWNSHGGNPHTRKVRVVTPAKLCGIGSVGIFH